MCGNVQACTDALRLACHVTHCSPHTPNPFRTLLFYCTGLLGHGCVGAVHRHVCSAYILMSRKCSTHLPFHACEHVALLAVYCIGNCYQCNAGHCLVCTTARPLCLPVSKRAVAPALRAPHAVRHIWNASQSSKKSLQLLRGSIRHERQSVKRPSKRRSGRGSLLGQTFKCSRSKAVMRTEAPHRRAADAYVHTKRRHACSRHVASMDMTE